MPTEVTQAVREVDEAPAAEPLVAVLPALAALGAIAAIACVLDHGGRDAGSDSKSVRRLAGALRDLESDTLILLETFRRLTRHVGAGGERPVLGVPLKFGLPGLMQGREAREGLQISIGDTARVLPRVTQNALIVIDAVGGGLLPAADELLYGFGDCQEALNRALADRVNIKAVLGTGLHVSERLHGLIRTLKERLPRA